MCMCFFDIAKLATFIVIATHFFIFILKSLGVGV